MRASSKCPCGARIRLGAVRGEEGVLAGTGKEGEAPEARLLVLQACVPRRAGSVEGICLAHRLVRALHAVFRYRARVANLSVGGPPNRVVDWAVLALSGRGVVVVAAAGNNGPDGPRLHPAALPGVLAVGAVGPAGEVYARSNLGPHVGVLAPGVDVLSTLPEGRYGFLTGTSYAAAVASGAVALLAEAAPDARAGHLIGAVRSGGVAGAVGSMARLDVCGALARVGRPEVCGSDARQGQPAPAPRDRMAPCSTGRRAIEAEEDHGAGPQAAVAADLVTR